ncbi:MAG TPA: transposase [Tenuifilaceae bacterium]|mgnify:CR=1 FL=1|nr:transposase [Tenuifilaceae bacterium]HPE19596.1 transposase [Tenuifilaceae bacterium]HPJ47021.1 transposase [Tenuifilaceae bacterium]HPQ35537.1 transposase [Tenuifilaceae bacterium]HRX69428.1 transposase [Tenuifilaceae bacterium]
MSTGYKIDEKSGAYFLTFQVVGWVDLFTRKDYRDMVIESFKYCQKEKGLNIFAYVIMSNHIHLLAQSEKDDLSGFIRDFKSFTSKRFIEFINGGNESRSDWLKLVFEYHGKFKKKQTNQVWTHENHAGHIFSQKFIEQKVGYIHNNPVRSGIVVNPEDYLYSSARNYVGLDSVIDIIEIDFRWKTYG